MFRHFPRRNRNVTYTSVLAPKAISSSTQRIYWCSIYHKPNTVDDSSPSYEQTMICSPFQFLSVYVSQFLARSRNATCFKYSNMQQYVSFSFVSLILFVQTAESYEYFTVNAFFSDDFKTLEYRSAILHANGYHVRIFELVVWQLEKISSRA